MDKKWISVSLIISTIILGTFFYITNKNVRTVRVVGHAAREYDSDILKWNITITCQSSRGRRLRQSSAFIFPSYVIYGKIILH